jgi:hypothetical protein
MLTKQLCGACLPWLASYVVSAILRIDLLRAGWKHSRLAGGIGGHWRRIPSLGLLPIQQAEDSFRRGHLTSRAVHVASKAVGWSDENG